MRITNDNQLIFYLNQLLFYLQDRVIFHRLEHICYCVETGEWPFPKRMSCIPMSYDSRSATPLGSTTPRDDQDLSQSDAGDSVYDGIKVNRGINDIDKDFEVQFTEVGSLRVWFSSTAAFLVFYRVMWFVYFSILHHTNKWFVVVYCC